MGLKEFFSFKGYQDDIRRIDVLEGERKICQCAIDRDAYEADECRERIKKIDEELAELRSKQK